ncbi:MAG: DUF1772 domain-containing protein [Flavobacteriaceae bacterium]
MEISIKSLVLLVTVMLTGLSAGLFYAWSVSVIPGTQKVVDAVYLQTMQQINRAILNPAFFLVYFGALVFLFASSFSFYGTNRAIFWMLLAAATMYLIGTVGVTGLGNVPLNNQLEKLDLSKINSEEMGAFRRYYESKWNRLHLIRTVFACCAFFAAATAVCFSIKINP